MCIALHRGVAPCKAQRYLLNDRGEAPMCKQIPYDSWGEAPGIKMKSYEYKSLFRGRSPLLKKDLYVYYMGRSPI